MAKTPSRQLETGSYHWYWSPSLEGPPTRVRILGSGRHGVHTLEIITTGEVKTFIHSSWLYDDPHTALQEAEQYYAEFLVDLNRRLNNISRIQRLINDWHPEQSDVTDQTHTFEDYYYDQILQHDHCLCISEYLEEGRFEISPSLLSVNPVIDYFPKKDRVVIPLTGEVIFPGLDYLIKTFQIKPRP